MKWEKYRNLLCLWKSVAPSCQIYEDEKNQPVCQRKRVTPRPLVEIEASFKKKFPRKPGRMKGVKIKKRKSSGKAEKRSKK